ncbi:hypothetical protein [Chitinophaga sp. CF118]|uniref:DUF922 domain-containing protein n=1 Tax=Chitinophaga sp. CF118 TaxID=1884367 RepID=UPI000B801017|nr:hypothetical protein [Chitinophaga sp. CF118]
MGDRPPLPDSALVVVLDERDRFYRNDEIGTINSFDNVLSTHCTYDEVIAKLKWMARSHGANLIKITMYKEADYKSTCDRITAKIYKVDNVKLYEKKFGWSSDRKLAWEDYKGNPAAIHESNVAATTNCRFGIRANPLFTSGRAKVFVTNEFICHQSSVRPEQKKPSLLEHEQLHFDLCEVYARKLRKELTDAHLTPLNVDTVSKDAFLKMYKLYRERQDLYDIETNHGLDLQAQKQWEHKIGEELEELSAYTN